MNDRTILRTLAATYCAEIANDPDKRPLYIGVNDLHMERPVVLIDEIPWNEMDFEGSLALQCTDPFFRKAEQYFRRELYLHRHLPADHLFLPYYPIRKQFHSSGNGVSVAETLLSTDLQNHIVSHEYEDQFASDEYLNKLHLETITYDQETSETEYAVIAEAIYDLLPVKLVGIEPYSLVCETWDRIVTYRGVTNLLIDLIDRPEFTHRLVERLTEIYIDKMQQFERLGLLDAEEPYIHCTAAISEDLPRPEPGKPAQLKNIWGRGIAQILASASKAMRDEFDIQSMKRTMAPFGLVYYGCCEPLHDQIDILEQLPNLRKISITPWADVDVAAEAIGSRYVLAAKPNSAIVAMDTFEESAAHKEISRIIAACRRNGCSFELTLKDISTVCRRPQNLFQWEKLAMEMVNA